MTVNNSDNIRTAHETYNIQYWSESFFDIDDNGYVTLGKTITGLEKKFRLQDIVNSCIAEDSSLSLPLLLRFPDILQARLKELTTAFAKAFANNKYNGGYLPAYPIKVNQQKSVLSGLIDGSDKIALEAGSKPELFTVLGLAAKHDLEVICNGYKDLDYIKLALLGQKIGLKVNIIVEKLSELDLVLQLANDLEITPRLGVRVRLSSLGKGKWQNTGGVKSKFGLTSLQLLAFIERLKSEDKLDYLKVLHFHLGSQISDITDIETGLKEGARLYAEVVRAGGELEAIDVGGGLGVDYEGTSSRSYYSINYNIESYANVVVKTIKDICEQENLAHPIIITESGRAMVAHHAVLVTNIIDIEPVVSSQTMQVVQHQDEFAKISFIKELKANLDDLDTNPRLALEIYYRAKAQYDCAQEEYIKGTIHLPVRAAAEQLYYTICLKLVSTLSTGVDKHKRLLDVLNEDMANKVFCNFSLFQSLPDIWGIGQLFPILPLKDLEKLNANSRETRGLIQDMTCDSDGRIDRYIDGQGVERSLPLPPLDKNDPYYLGFFMVGAYQEILGDLHNLFGDTATVDIKISNNDFHIDNSKQASQIKELIDYVDFDGNVLLENLFSKYKSLESDFAKQKNVFDFLKKYIRKSPYFV